MELTEQFVCLVRRMMDAGYTLDDVVGFMHEQAEPLHRISTQLTEHGETDHHGQRPRTMLPFRPTRQDA